MLGCWVSQISMPNAMAVQVENEESETMAQVPSVVYGAFYADTEIWYGLKCAIASTSGFQSWQVEKSAQLQGLRDTLETLAY